MSINGPFILAPVEITDAVLDSSTVAEPAAGETAWVSAGTYAVGDQRIRATTHRIYSCILAHTGITTLPEDDLTNWTDIGPTLRWAMFDGTVSTDTTATTTLTVVLSPGFFNALALYKLTGSHITVTVKDEPGGATIYTYDDDLYEPFPDWYEWLFAPYRNRERLILRDIVPYPDAELTITVTAAAAAAVGIGMVCIGDLRPLAASEQRAGTQYGASIEPVDYSYVKTDEFGTTRIVRRASTTGLRASVFLPQEDADYAIALLQEVLSVPVTFVAVDESGYANANVFGLVSGSVSYSGPNHAIANINVKGLI